MSLVRVDGVVLDTLIGALDVRFVRLSECLVGPGFGLQLGSIDSPGIHYNVAGRITRSRSRHSS